MGALYPDSGEAGALNLSNNSVWQTSPNVAFMAAMRGRGLFGAMAMKEQAALELQKQQELQRFLQSQPITGNTPGEQLRSKALIYSRAGLGDQAKQLAETANALEPHETYNSPITVLQGGQPRLALPGSRGNMRVVEGASPYERGDEAEMGRILDQAGITDQKQRQAVFTALAQKKASHQPAASVNVSLGKGLADKASDIAAAGRDAAAGAVDIVATVDRVSKALESGNVNLGPGSTVLNKVDQVAQILGVGGKDTSERLVNTRNVIRGLAQFAVGARKAYKGQGQVSDYEGKLIQRAEAGEINEFTIPELKDFLKVTDRLARKAHSEHKRIIGVMGKSQDEAVRGLVPYFDIPDLPTPAKEDPKPAAPATVDFNSLPKRR